MKKYDNVAIFFGVFVVIIFALNYNNLDYINYKNAYFLNTIGNSDVLFTFLIKCSNFISLPYQGFRIAISIMCFSIIFLSLKKNNCSYIIFFVLYCIYSLYYDYIQIRFFLATSIFVAGLVSTEYSSKKFLFYTILSALVHSIFYVFIIFPIFLFVSKKCKNSVLVFLVIVITLLSLILGLSGSISLIIEYLSNYIHRLNYYSDSRMRYGSFVYIFFQLVNLFFAYLIYKKKYRNTKCYIIFNLNVYCSFFLPLLFLESTFFRFARVLILVNIFLLSTFDLKRNKSIIILFSLYLFSIFSIEFLNNKSINEIIIPFFKDNFLIDFLRRYL